MPTLPNREAYLQRWISKHMGYERRAYKMFKSALDAQVAPVIKHIKTYGSITPDLADMLVRKEPMESAYKSVYIEIGVKQAGITLREINSVKALGFFSDAWRRVMELFYTTEAASRVSDVTDTTREKIRRVLDEANALNLSVEATADYIVEQLGDKDFNRNRALVIARTESTTAANKGASLGNADADYETVKEWLSVSDRNTRHTHLVADGQQVGNTEDFVIGGELAQFPGDTRLSAKEVVQCRCTAAYVPVLVNGLPVLK